MFCCLSTQAKLTRTILKETHCVFLIPTLQHMHCFKSPAFDLGIEKNSIQKRNVYKT